MTDIKVEPTMQSTGRSAHTKTQAVGLGLLAASVISLLIAGLITGLDIGEVVGFLLVPAIVLLVGAGLTLRFGTWAKAVGLVITLAAAAMLFWLAFGIFEPASFVDFIAGVSFVVGFFMALGGGIAALVKRKVAGPTPLEDRLTRGALAVVVLAVAVSVPLWFFSRSTVSDAEAAAATPIVAHDFAFEPGELTVAPDETLLIDNNDAFLHTFTIEELGIDVELLPGDETLISLGGADTGTYTFYCKPHSSPDNPDPGPDSDDMAGTITVS